MSNKSVVDISPTKNVFVDAITRDITIEKSLMDLIDNSIDGAKRSREGKTYKGYYIRIFFSKQKFTIEDNCGGISIEDAKNYVFRFGNDGEHLKSYSSGGFGIGMKRAFFKMGKDISVVSITDKSAFRVRLDVDKWLKQESWTIEVESLNRMRRQIGTSICIKRINRGVSKRLDEDDFLMKLRRMVEKHYRKEIGNGLEIYINAIKINDRTVSQKEIYRKNYTFKNIEVEVSIMRGEACLEESGWQIALNEKVVTFADKSELTGWDVVNKAGEKTIWDDQIFQEFRGYINAKAKESLLLPFTTTKDSLDTNSEIYRFMLNKMIEALRESNKTFKENKRVNIQYKKAVEEVERLKKNLNVATAKDVGIKTYEVYVEENNIM